LIKRAASPLDAARPDVTANSAAAETAVNLMQNRSMLRVEWYIVALIVFEVLLYSYDIWFKY